jgi:hypothetical protein
MRIIELFSPRRCRFCKRGKEQAKQEQVVRGELCPGGEQCPFQAYIDGAIREAWKAELLSFDLSSEDVLEGEAIRVNWQTKNCASVSISDYGDVPPSGTVTLEATQLTRQIELNLVDLFGQAFNHTRRIRVRRKPRLELMEYHDRVLTGEQSLIRFKARNARQVLLRDLSGGTPTRDLTNEEFFTTEPLTRDARFALCAIGKDGGEAQQEISVRVFEPPLIDFFRADAAETVDTLPVRFSFECRNDSRVEIFRDGVSLVDVTGVKNYTYFAENRTGAFAAQTFSLVVTGPTGATATQELEGELFVYPQPSIRQIDCRPGGVILFPQPAAFTAHADFCEKILLFDGQTIRIVEPDAPVEVRPSSDTQYVFTPVGKLGFRGQPRTATIQVVYPVEIEATASKKVTLPNLPVTISWSAKNHTQILLEPGGIDVTNLVSYDLRLEHKTVVKVWAVNQLDRKAAEVFVDVLSYPRFDGTRLFGGLPRPELEIPEIKHTTQPALTGRVPSRPVPVLRLPHLPVCPRSLPSLSVELLSSFKCAVRQSGFGQFRTLRGKLFRELRAKAERDVAA